MLPHCLLKAQELDALTAVLSGWGVFLFHHLWTHCNIVFGINFLYLFLYRIETLAKICNLISKVLCPIENDT